MTADPECDGLRDEARRILGTPIFSRPGLARTRTNYEVEISDLEASVTPPPTPSPTLISSVRRDLSIIIGVLNAIERYERHWNDILASPPARWQISEKKKAVEELASKGKYQEAIDYATELILDCEVSNLRPDIYNLLRRIEQWTEEENYNRAARGDLSDLQWDAQVAKENQLAAQKRGNFEDAAQHEARHNALNRIINLRRDKGEDAKKAIRTREVEDLKENWKNRDPRDLNDRLRNLERERLTILGGGTIIPALQVGKRASGTGYTKAEEYDEELAALKELTKKRKKDEQEVNKHRLRTGLTSTEDIKQRIHDLEKQRRDFLSGGRRGEYSTLGEYDEEIKTLNEMLDEHKKGEREVRKYDLEHGRAGALISKEGTVSNFAGWFGFGEEPAIGIGINLLAVFITFLIVYFGIIGPILDTFSFFIPFLSLLSAPIYVIATIIFHPFVKAIFHPLKKDIYDLLGLHKELEEDVGNAIPRLKVTP